MRPNNVHVAGYRAFLLPAQLDLRPLTLVFGDNNSGKSRLLRLLYSARESIVTRSNHPLVAFEANSADRSGRDMYSVAQPELVMSIDFDWSGNTARYQFRYLPDLGVSILENLELREVDQAPLALRWEVATPEYVHDALFAQYRVMDSRSTSSYRVGFRGLLPVDAADLTPMLKPRFTTLRQLLMRLTEQTFWLGPLRAVPGRIQRTTERPARPTTDGANVGQYLAVKDELGAELVSFTSNWFADSTGHRLNVVPGVHAGDSLFSLTLSPVTAPLIQVPIADAGEGMGQVLPVVTCLGLIHLGQLDPEPVFAFEHPELHLHTGVHAKLAQLFCKVADGSSNPALLVETHSEGFLLAVQTAIASGEIDPAKVIVHWVRQLDDGYSAVDIVRFDELGQPTGPGWPPTAFRDVSKQALDLAALRHKKTQPKNARRN